jgi:hypothetical protein
MHDALSALDCRVPANLTRETVSASVWGFLDDRVSSFVFWGASHSTLQFGNRSLGLLEIQNIQILEAFEWQACVNGGPSVNKPMWSLAVSRYDHIGFFRSIRRISSWREMSA